MSPEPSSPQDSARPQGRKRLAISDRQKAELPIWLIFAATLLVIVWANRWFMTPYAVWLNIDEGYIGAFAMRMIHGRWLPYVDAVSHRGPMLYWLAAIAFKLFGAQWWVIRALSLGMGLWVAVGGMWAAAKVGKPLIGAAGALGWALMTLVVWNPVDGAAFNGEYVLNAFSIAALVTLVHATRRAPSTSLGTNGASHRHLWFFVTGALIALGGLSKQVGVVLAIPFGLWTLAASLSRPRDPLEKRRWWTLAFIAGGAFPVLITLARYAIAGELSTFWYYAVTYNQKIYLAPMAGHEGKVIGEWLRANVLWLTIGVTIVGAWLGLIIARSRGSKGLLVAYDRRGFGATLAISALLSALASNASLRGWGHYALQFAPWVGLLGGFVIDRFAPVPRRPRAAIFYTLVLLPAFAALAWGWSRQETRFNVERKTGLGWTRPEASPACAYVEQHSKPDEPIFIWGFRAIWYLSCHRLPASRFVFTTFPAGVVPWYAATAAQEEARTVPGSRELLLSELEATRPAIIFDVPASMMNRSIGGYPKLAAFVFDNYCNDGPVEDATAFVRKNPDGSCPEPPAAR